MYRSYRFLQVAAVYNPKLVNVFDFCKLKIAEQSPLPGFMTDGGVDDFLRVTLI